MTSVQKTIVISTLAILALFLHVIFCNWETGEYHRALLSQHRESVESVVIPMGRFAAIHARSLNTYAVDAVLGVALPIALIGWGCFILAAPRRNAAVGFVLLAVVLTGCPRDDMAKLGQQVPPHFELYQHGALVDASTLLQTHAAPGGRFRAAADSSGVVQMIIPVAADFESPEGISQGSTLADVRDVTQANLVKVPGYGFLVALPSGWTAVLCVGATMTDSEPAPEHPVAFICKR